jgi:hypothetical protein
LVPLCKDDGTVSVSTDAYIGGMPIYRACKLDELHPTCDEANKPTGGPATGYVYLAGAGFSTPTESGTATTGGAAGATSSTVAYPTSSVAAGRVAYIFGHSATKATTVTTPSGWTVVRNFTITSGSDEGRQFCFRKVLTGSESGSVTVAFSASTDSSLIMAVENGVNNTTPESAGTSAYGFVSSLAIPGAPPTSSNDRLLACIGQAGNTPNYAKPPTGWTKLAESRVGNSCIALFAKTAGTTSATAVTINTYSDAGYTTASTLNEIGMQLAIASATTPLASFSIGEGATVGHFTGLGKSLSQWDRLHYAVTADAGCKGLQLLHKLIDP